MKVKNEDILEALEGIRKTGPLTPSRVVHIAKDEGSILHPVFEWDDRKAGHQHRLWQARQLITTRVFRPEGARRVLSVYVHHASGSGEGEYLPVQSIVTQQDKFSLARDAAIRGVIAAQDNVSELDEAQRLFGNPERTVNVQKRTTRAKRLLEGAQAQLVGI